jgi:hypothetical protein
MPAKCKGPPPNAGRRRLGCRNSSRATPSFRCDSPAEYPKVFNMYCHLGVQNVVTLLRYKLQQQSTAGDKLALQAIKGWLAGPHGSLRVHLVFRWVSIFNSAFGRHW